MPNTGSDFFSSIGGFFAANSGTVMLVVMMVVLLLVMIIPQRKRDKADESMRNNLEVGDVVTTRGGIVGKITNIKDDQLTLQTGSDSVKIRVMRWAVAKKEEKISD